VFQDLYLFVPKIACVIPNVVPCNPGMFRHREGRAVAVREVRYIIG